MFQKSIDWLALSHLANCGVEISGNISKKLLTINCLIFDEDVLPLFIRTLEGSRLYSVNRKLFI